MLDGRPIAHVAAEGGVSRQSLGKWVHRYLELGEQGLEDRTSRPDNIPFETPPEVVEAVLAIRADKKWGAARIAAWLKDVGPPYSISHSTVQRILERYGMNQLRDLDMPTGESKREVHRYEHNAPGQMIHVDIKKFGRIPDGGGWFAHGRGSEEALLVARANRGKRAGWTYVHNAVDDHSRLAYSEVHYNETGETCHQFWLRAVVFYREHGIGQIHRCLTDNGVGYKSKRFAEALTITETVHKRTRAHRPQTNGKVERYNQPLMKEWAYAQVFTSETDRTAALADFLNYYNHERPHSALGFQPPASRVPIKTYRVPAQPDYLPEVTAEDLVPQPGLFDL